MLKKNDILHTSFDKYLILEKIGEGGNGTVYKVQSEDGKTYAAKVICKNDVSKEKIKRFKNEIGFCQKYDNDHIIKVVDNGYLQVGGKEYLFYIMPYYEYSLRKSISDGLNIETAVQIFLNLCEGLRFAHSKRCIHRDIKPENILIKSLDNSCVIADFGIAHFIDCDQITTVETKETSRLANFTYHAPEQSYSSSSATPMTDIFALGLILNEMITGFVPAGDNYKKISDVDANYAFLDRIVSKMICQNPQDRYQNIEELLVDYEARQLETIKQNKIIELQKPVEDVEIHNDLIEHPITINNITTANGALTIQLSNSPDILWKQIYPNTLGHYHSYPLCYQFFQFRNNIATLPLQGVTAYGNGFQIIKDVVDDFKQAVSITNKQYKAKIIENVRMEKEREIKRRQDEIRRLEQENSLNEYLKKLI